MFPCRRWLSSLFFQSLVSVLSTLFRLKLGHIHGTWCGIWYLTCPPCQSCLWVPRSLKSWSLPPGIKVFPPELHWMTEKTHRSSCWTGCYQTESTDRRSLACGRHWSSSSHLMSLCQTQMCYYSVYPTLWRHRAHERNEIILTLILPCLSLTKAWKWLGNLWKRVVARLKDTHHPWFDY